ncbi:ATP-binding protein [Janibacter melonis]|nr:ATP-binding protein [Janibacter melonis]
MMVFFSPHHDLQLRDFQKLPEIRASLPRKPNDLFYLVDSQDPRAATKLEDWTVREPFAAACLPRNMPSTAQGASTILDALKRCLASRNLYEETLPVTGANFFGRRDLLIDLSDQLRGGKVCGVFGLRKTGKTSLIAELGRQFTVADPDNRIFLLRDLEDLPSDTAQHAAAIQADLTASLLPQLRRRGLRTHELSRLSSTSSLGEFRLALQASLRHENSAGVQVVLALDEIESLIGGEEDLASERPHVPEFFGLLRSLVQENDNFNVVISGLTNAVLERGVLFGRENPLFAWAKPYYVPPLDNAEAKKLITDLGARMALSWNQDALDAVFHLTEGHVFLHRSLCAHIASGLPRDADLRLVTAEMVQASIRPWRRAIAEQVKQMMLSLERFYPDAAALLSLLLDGQIAWDEADDLYPSQLNHLLQLGLVTESPTAMSMTAFSRLASRA